MSLKWLSVLNILLGVLVLMFWAVGENISI
jgi:hypothetical protein